MQFTQILPPTPIEPKKNGKLELLDIDPLELARQLTVMEIKLFAKIQRMECLNRAENGKPRDPDNISAVIEANNKIAEWVVDSVLSKDDSKKRAAIVEHFIAVANCCRLLQNFSTLTAIVAGLNSPPIRRLKHTWEHVNAQSMAQFQELERIMNPNTNFTNYRTILKTAQLPCVPFLGVYLGILMLNQDVNKDIAQAEVVREIRHYQSMPHNFTVLPDILDFIDESLSAQGIDHCPGDLSLQREPRDSSGSI